MYIIKRTFFGAGSENRTRAIRSEAWDSTTKLYPHNQKYYNTNMLFTQVFIQLISMLIKKHTTKSPFSSPQSYDIITPSEVTHEKIQNNNIRFRRHTNR